MSITIKQLETLARYFHFDINEARSVIGIELKKTRGCSTAKSCNSDSDKDKISGNYCVKANKKVQQNKDEKPKNSTPRGPSGYNLFVREKGISFKNAGQAWKQLSDAERQRWNLKAKA